MSNRLCPELAQTYEKYGQDIRDGAPVGWVPAGSTPFDAKNSPNGRPESSYGLDSRGLRGKVVKTAGGSRKFVGVPMQKRDHFIPKGYLTPAEKKARADAEAVAVSAFFAAGGTIKQV